MKKVNYFLVLLFFCAFTMSFTDTSDVNEIKDNGTELLLKIDLPENLKEQSWGRWNTTDCLRGLDFRVRNDGYNKYAKKYRWSIQFRNRYKKKLHLSYKAVPPNESYSIRQSGRTTDRIHIDPNYGTYKSYYLVKSSKSIYVYVNKIRLGKKDYGSDYINCDK